MTDRRRQKQPRDNEEDRGKAIRSKLDVRSLETFLAVSDAGTMTGAAARLGISQAAVSQQIAQLEALFGRRLFERSTRQLSHTPAGLSLRHSARRVLDEVNSAQQAMRLFRDFTVPHLTIGINDSLTDILTSAIIASLSTTVERLEIRGGGTADHRESLMSDRLDMIISADPPRTDEVDVFSLATDPMILIVPRGFFDRHCVDLEALAATLPMARLVRQRQIGKLIDRYLARRGVVISRAFEFDHDRLMLDAVCNGQAWTIASPFALLHTGIPETLISVHSLPAPAPTRTIGLAFKKNRHDALPTILAAACRKTLATAVRDRLTTIAPTVASQIAIFSNES